MRQERDTSILAGLIPIHPANRGGVATHASLLSDTRRSWVAGRFGCPLPTGVPSAEAGVLDLDPAIEAYPAA